MISLSKHIEILLLDHDLVIVPTFGGFLTNNNEASHISTDENAQDTLLPPTRTIGFNPSLTINDGLLVQSYMHHYDASYPQAFKQMEFDIKQMLQSLNNTGSYTFANIGTVTLDMHQRMQFTPLDKSFVAPLFFGLPKLQLQSAAECQNQRDIRLALTESTTLTVVKTKEEKKATGTTKRLALRRWIDIAISAAAAIVLFFALFHNTLKTPTASQPVMVSSCVAGASSDITDADAFPGSESAVAEEESNEAKSVAEPVTEYAIILASGVTLANAENYINQMQTQGYKSVRLFTQNDYHRIAFDFYKDRETASQELLKLRQQSSEFAQAWIMEVNR